MRKICLAIRAAILLAVMAVCCSSLAGTIPGGFTQMDMECGGYLPVVIQHASGRLYARTDGGGIYSSDDHGNSWSYLSGDMTSAAALIPQGIAVPQSAGSSSNLIIQAVGVDYLASDPGRGIWKSTNGGGSWTQTLSGVNFSGNDQERIGGECLIFHPDNDSEVWAGSRGQGLWKSSDAGNTWLQAGGTTLASTIIACVYIHPAFPDQIFVGGDGGLWVSANHGGTWVFLKSFSLVMRVTRASDGTVYLGGINNGTQVLQKITATNWADPTSYVFTDLIGHYQSGIGSSGNPIVCLTLLRDGRLVAGDYESHTRISNDGGMTFTTLSQAFVPGSVVPKWANADAVWAPTSLTQDVFATNTWYGGSGYAPIRTDDGGQTWQYIVNGMGEVVAFKVGFHPTDPNRVYIPGSDHAGAVVTNGGYNNSVASMATPFFPWPDDIVMYSHRALASTNNGINRVIFPGGEEINNTARIYVTTNDGTSWYKMAAAGLPTAGNEAIVDAMDSLDNPDDYLVVCCGTSGSKAAGVYRTTDGGATFTQSSGLPAGQWFGDVHSWYVSIDRDATNVNERYLYDRASYPNSGGFFRSMDRGATWTQIPWPLLPDWYGIIASDHAISGSLWIAMTPSNPGTNGLGHSSDGGNSWSIVPGFTSVTAVDAYNGGVCIFGERTNDGWNKIYYSTNNGSTWDEITRPGHRFSNTTDVACDPHHPGRVWIGTAERSVGIFTPGTMAITNSVKSGPNLILNGNAGAANANGLYSVLAASNLATPPMSNWNVVATGQQLDASGHFNYTATNALAGSNVMQFYRVRSP